MKSQHIAVLFIIIILPIALVMSYTIGKQMDTIKLQNEYNKSLTNATYDAVKAFQINTVNNRYSSISASKIRDIEASINTFFTSLSDNEPLSEEQLKTYVPALVYTMYDGYYIYSKYDNIYPTNNGQPILDEEVLKQYDANYGLKPYIYYSCRYRTKNGTKDFIVNYTLDNAITVYGDLGNGYETKSGYLIAPELVEVNSYNADNPLSWKLTYDGVSIVPEELTEHLLFADKTNGDYNYIVYNGQKIYYDKDAQTTEKNTAYFYYQDYAKSYIPNYDTNKEIINYLTKRTNNGKLFSTSSFEYYYNAKQFSQYIIDKIGDIKQSDAVELDENNNFVSVDFYIKTQDEKIFNVSKTNDPLLSNSTFDENRKSVIRKSIETNLTAAIANYNMYTTNTYEFKLPVLNEIEWEKITNNVSVISFLQGIPIGYKYYNNYCVITNNDNEEVVKKENIYIITQEDDGTREYHLPGCTHLLEMTKTIQTSSTLKNTNFSTSDIIQNSDILLIGDESAYTEETKTITVKLSSNDQIGVVSGIIKTNEYITNIQLKGINGWAIESNPKEEGIIFNLRKADGAKEEDILEITYTAANKEETGNISLTNLNITNIQYQTQKQEDIKKEIKIIKPEEPDQILLIGDESAYTGETKTITVKLSSNDQIGVVSGIIKTNEYITNIQLKGVNGWAIESNPKEEGIIFNLRKADGAKEEDILEITYTAANKEGTGNISLTNLNITNIQYQTQKQEDIKKEIKIIKPKEPDQILLIGDESAYTSETKTITVKLSSNDQIGVVSGIIKTNEYITNIQLKGVNGWAIESNPKEEGIIFNLRKADGAKEEDILKITYTAANKEGTGNISLTNLNITNIQYQTQKHDDVEKNIIIKKDDEGYEITKQYTISGAYANISFIRQTVRIAEGDYLYFYPLTRIENPFLTTCYYCIVNANSSYDVEDIIKGEIIVTKENEKNIKINSSNNVNFKNIREAYIRALGRERYHLYQVNMDAFNQ